MTICSIPVVHSTPLARQQTNMEQHVFSKNNKFFASISENGVLKVWDAETQTLKCDYIPNLQTSAPCTSFLWVTLAQVRL